MQVTFSSAIGVAALRAAVRQHSRREVCRITQCGQRPIIPLAISWVYGRRWLILAVTQRPRGLLLTQRFQASLSFSPTALPAIARPVLPHPKRFSFRLAGQRAVMAPGFIRNQDYKRASPALRTTFLQDAGEEGKRLQR